MKIIAEYWFTPMGHPGIGIIIRDNGIDKRAYIGETYGKSRDFDAQEILQKGAKLTPLILREILNYLE